MTIFNNIFNFDYFGLYDKIKFSLKLLIDERFNELHGLNNLGIEPLNIRSKNEKCPKCGRKLSITKIASRTTNFYSNCQR